MKKIKYISTFSGGGPGTHCRCSPLSWRRPIVGCVNMRDTSGLPHYMYPKGVVEGWMSGLCRARSANVLDLLKVETMVLHKRNCWECVIGNLSIASKCHFLDLYVS
uniref:Uncharacterized protein n=1 Tax=Lepeophtheirus salmonis TaxID=72036 RepID=A0A0K2UGF0_LEPSM